MNRWNPVTVGAPGVRREIVSQAGVRIVICAFMGGYYSAFGVPNHPLYLVFALYSFALLLIAQRFSGLSNVVPILTLIADNGFAIWGLHVTGERGAFLLFFLIHFSFAYGIRYGRWHLFGSLVISCAGVTWLYWKSFPWQGHIHFLLSFLFGMPFISIYVYVLTEKLRKSEASATNNARRTEKLLVFLAHDIRTPLHQLLGSINKLQVSAYAEVCASTLNHMESLVNLMARMCSGIVSGRSVTGSGRPRRGLDGEDPQSATLNQRIVASIELFRDRMESEGAILRYDLSCQIAPNVSIDVSAVERALLNVVSNAARHCRDGYVEVRVRPGSRSDPEIVIEIENARATVLDGFMADSAPANGEFSAFFGASMGMESMRDVTSSAGGTFDFQALNNSRFLSTLIFPIGAWSLPYRAKTLLPVVAISRDIAFFSKCCDMLSTAANVYCYTSLENFTSHIRSYDGEIAAIFADLSDTIGSADLGNFDEFVDRHSLVVTLSSRIDDLDRILIQGRRIRIDRESGRSTWLQVLQLSEDLRTSRTWPSTRNDCSLGTLTAARILALDDNSLNLSLLAVGLSNYGLSIKPTGSLTDAMRELSQEKYDVFVLDWNIGDVTASEILRIIQDGPLALSLKILLLTAQNIDFEELQVRFTENIVVLTKPVDNATILAAIRRLWQRPSRPSAEAIETSADRIFYSRGYDDMKWNSDSIEAIDSLLGRFLADIEERVVELTIQIPTLSHEDLDRSLHALAGICYSVGAYALGDEFTDFPDRQLDFSREGSRRGGCFPRMRDILALTKMHISIFQLSVRARSVP